MKEDNQVQPWIKRLIIPGLSLSALLLAFNASDRLISETPFYHGHVTVNGPQEFDTRVSWRGNERTIQIYSGKIEKIDTPMLTAKAWGDEPFTEVKIFNWENAPELSQYANQQFLADTWRRLY